jgi:hypothetical protein
MGGGDRVKNYDMAIVPGRAVGGNDFLHFPQAVYAAATARLFHSFLLLQVLQAEDADARRGCARIFRFFD